MKKNVKITTKSPKETIALGRKFARSLKGREVIALIGDLGGGKTTFTKGVARGLGIKKPIRSPSFVLMNSHEIPGKKGLTLHHLDAYRLTSLTDISSLGLSDVLGRPKAIVLVEWADNVINKLPKITHLIEFKFVDENRRNIKINLKLRVKNSSSKLWV